MLDLDFSNVFKEITRKLSLQYEIMNGDDLGYVGFYSTLKQLSTYKD